MIDRYTLPRMGKLWEPQNRFETWLKIEIWAVEAWAELGKIPHEAVEKIKKAARFDLARIQEIEQEVKHDVIAFVTAVSENLGDESHYLHMGLTSSDILDTALAMLLAEAADILIEDVTSLLTALEHKAWQYKDTLMIGRSHGVHAEPITFGLKMALWYAEMRRNLRRIQQARKTIAVGKISGAVGTFANVPPEVEAIVCQKAGLRPAAISTQVIQRDRHAEFFTTLAIIGASIEKMATEIRHLQRTEVLEAEEAFGKGQKGSSAMPHKKNPVVSEQMCGLARILRANAIAAIENVPLWHERDISHSSVERIIAPDSTILLDYMLNTMSRLIENLQVYPDRMRKNLELTQGLIFSQRVLLELVAKGVLRDEAYRMVQQNAMRCWQGEGSFQNLLSQDPDISRYLTPQELAACFDVSYHLKYIDILFHRVFHEQEMD
ncbi:MAG: adenylosuccinate lyase [bacterium]|nr:adenylosuccinate lyase [bacterium]